MRIATETFSHETNTFFNIPTTMEEFANRGQHDENGATFDCVMSRADTHPRLTAMGKSLG